MKKIKLRKAGRMYTITDKDGNKTKERLRSYAKPDGTRQAMAGGSAIERKRRDRRVAKLIEIRTKRAIRKANEAE